MATPADLSGIRTNLPHKELRRVLRAIEDGNVAEVPDSHSLFAEAREWRIRYGKSAYKIEEFSEVISAIEKVPIK